MQADLFIGYIDMLNSLNNQNLEDYYKSEEDYINALRNEESMSASNVFGAMSNLMQNGNIGTSVHFNSINSNNIGGYERELTYAKCTCSLFNGNGSLPETIDSVVQHFVDNKEFAMTIRLALTTADDEFIEEFKEWWKETSNILAYAKKQDYDSDWVDENTPKRQLKMDFINKSGKTIHCELDKCEILEKISNIEYVLYINKLIVLR